ncbi:MAG: ABC transporter ATP-binding protein/permease [Butyrivibrio sp.]|jgi:ABC-type transport system involved in cytochrome bd biosynthesis fused ATPase/permease subunit|nr:ABC transporter ATP-binding protein/permease [Butyrivibrio sp.]MBE5841080.1 ABC transporter ATP-binding protein/permease [Butyrivibrio sp.]
MFDKRLMAMCPESKKYIVGNIFCQWIELMMNALMIYIIAGAVGKLYRSEMTAKSMLLSLGILACVLIVRFFMTKKSMEMSYLASKTVKRVMREQIYKKILRLGNTYREHSTTAELVQESVEGVEQLESYFGQYVPQFFYAFLAPVTLFVLFGIAGSFKVAGVLLVCVPLIPGAIMMVQKIAKKLLSKYWDRYAKLGSTFLENLQGMTTLKTYKADALKNDQMNEESENFRRITMKVLTMQLNSIIIMDFFAYGGAALGIALAGKAFIDGSLTLESTVFMILLSADFFLPMRKLGSYFHVAMNGMAASNRIFKFLSEQEPKEKTALLPEKGLNISLSDVSFSYDGAKQVLSNVSMDICENSFTGIVGESGSGKSTVASLIMGRNTIKKGNLTIAGLNVADINEDSLFKNINYVGIGSTFFKGTVRENLLMANPKASDEMLWNVLAECNIDEFFQEEKGLDTLLTENAGNLSGGQKQRLALARAILHDAKVYIFDEATSNIDIESEELILSEIKKLARTNTVIMITHRLMNVVDADRIYCMESGRVSGMGTHAKLLETDAIYKKLWNTQKELEEYGKGGAAV